MSICPTISDIVAGALLKFSCGLIRGVEPTAGDGCGDLLDIDTVHLALSTQCLLCCPKQAELRTTRTERQHVSFELQIHL
jgi:hypothetical protein